MCEAQKNRRLSKNLPLRGRCPEGAEGENLAIARNISGSRTVLSPTACGRSPLAEGAKGGAHLFRHAGIFLCFAQKKSQHHGRGRACPARGLTESARLREPPRADIESAPTGNRCRSFCGLYVGRRTANFPAMADVRGGLWAGRPTQTPAKRSSLPGLLQPCRGRACPARGLTKAPVCGNHPGRIWNPPLREIAAAPYSGEPRAYIPQTYLSTTTAARRGKLPRRAAVYCA